MRSRHSTTISTWKSASAEPSHSTSIMRSGCAIRPFTLGQLARCTDTPRPRVTKPTMSSPATGLQQCARRTSISISPPLTSTPELPWRRFSSLP